MFFDEKNKMKVEKKEEPKASEKNEKKEITSFEDAWDNFSGTHFI
jgi:hypothetical protein